MLKQSALPVLAALLLTCGCSDDTELRVAALSGPSGSFGLPPAPFASINPAFAPAELVRGGGCPGIHPFRVPFNLIIQAGGDVSIQLFEVRMRFVDASGIAAPQITLAAPALTRQFGTALVNARSARTFPFDFGFGCGTGRTGTLIVIVRARHGDGRDESDELRMGVR